MPLYSIGNQIPTSFISISIESISIFSSPFSSINLEHVDSDISSLLSSWSALSFSFSSFRLRVDAIFANSSTLSNLASSPSPYKGINSYQYLIFGGMIRININNPKCEGYKYYNTSLISDMLVIVDIRSSRSSEAFAEDE